MSGITLITATGMRPEALALCASYVARFEQEPLQWIVVDDGEIPSEIHWNSRIELTRIFPRPAWKLGENTLARNLLAAFERVRYEKIFFIEDDDWYGTDYLRSMEDALDEVLLVGEVPARYYNLRERKYWMLDNHQHASLCQTGIRREVIPVFAEICRQPGRIFFDVRLWEHPMPRRLLESGNCVGMKGLPGRAGIGIGHRPETGSWKSDPDGGVLRSWIGAVDSARYGVLRGTPEATLPLNFASEVSGGYKVSIPVSEIVPSDSLHVPGGVNSAPPGGNPGQTEFETFYFMGQLRYKCNQAWESGAPCEYDTYDLQAIREHARQPHNRTGKAEPRRIQRVSSLVDQNGKPLVVNEDAPPEFREARFREEN